MAEEAPGLLEERSLREAGFNDDEINSWRQETAIELGNAGFEQKDVDEYFGIKEPDMEPMRKYFEKNLSHLKQEESAAPSELNNQASQLPGGAAPEPKQSEGFLEALEAGWQISVAGLMKRQKSPDLTLSPDAGKIATIASHVATLAGDVPAIIAGAAGGAAAGTAVAGPVGTVVGGGAGGNALPTFVRETLMSAYEKGEVQDFDDFYNRASAVLWETAKSGTVGAVSMGAGKYVGKVAGPLIGTGAARVASTTSELGTMVTVGAALEGEVPKADDFINAAGVIGVTHGTLKVASKLRKTYAKTGANPAEVVMDAQQDTVLHQELVSENIEVPSKLAPLIEEKAYHGTFEEFAPADIKVSEKGSYGPGFYLTKEKAQAGVYGDKILEYNVKASKLFDVTEGSISKSVESFAEKHGLDLSRMKTRPKESVYWELINRIREKYPNEDMVGTNAVHKLNELLKADGFEGVQFSQNGSNNNLVLFDKKSFSVPGEKVDAPKASNDAANKILSQVGELEPEGGTGIKEKAKESFDSFYRNFVDRLDPIKQAEKELAGGKELPANESPYTLHRMAGDFKSKTRHVIEHGTLDFKTLEKKGKSLKEVVEPHLNEMPDFEAYLISKRAIEIEASGRKSGFDLEAANTVVSTGKLKFEKAAKELVEFQNNNLKYLKDSGRISEKTFEALVEAGKDYIPFSRVFEGVEAVGKGKSNPLKRLKGSDKKIRNPFVSIMENTEQIFKIAEQNRAVKSFVELAEKTPGQKVIEKVPTRLKPIEIKPGELKRALEEQGLDADGVEAITVFRGASKDLGPHEFEVYRNGKREIYKAQPEVAEAIKSLDGNAPAKNIFFKMAANITAAKKVFITLMPDFIIKNIFRDQLTAGTFTKGAAIPFKDMLGAVGNLIRKDDVYYNWLKSGGGGGAFLDLDTNYLQKNIFKLDQEVGFLGKTWNVIKTPVDILKVAGNLADNATRLGEFKAVTKGVSSGPKVFEGGFAAREVTVDFQRIGAKMSALNAITAFQNVSIQGLDRSIRAVKENPVGVTSKAIGLITVPSVLLWWANKDDERVKEIPRWQKDLFWIIPTDNWVPVESDDEAASLPAYLLRQNKGKTEVNRGVIYRLPKPQELGILFGSMPERALEAFFKDNPNAMKDFGDTMVELITPSFMPDMVAPMVEQKFNHSLFTDRPIVPNHLEKILPEYQYTDYTTEAGKQLAKLIALAPGGRTSSFASPMVLDNYIRSWTGPVGQYAIKLTEKSLYASGLVPDPVKPADTLADIPFIKAFVIRNPSATAQSIVDFQNRAAQNKKVQDTIKFLAKSQDFKSVEKEMVMEENKDKFMRLDGINEAISAQHRMIRMIYKDTAYSADEKRQLIDDCYYQMIQVARQGNELVKELDEMLKANEVDTSIDMGIDTNIDLETDKEKLEEEGN